MRGFAEYSVENTRMVIDEIGNASLYYSLAPGIETALRYLDCTDFSGVEPGRYEIGGGCHAIVQDYSTKPRDEKRFEAHKAYIDVQFIASGKELMGYAEIITLDLAEDYDASKDITWLKGDGAFLVAKPGTFVILFPHDAHMPGVSIDKPEAVRKVVVKVPVH